MEFFDLEEQLLSFQMPQFWFIVDLQIKEPGCSATSNAEPQYDIICSDDILLDESYAENGEGYLKFFRQQEIVKGKVIFTAGSKESAEEKLQEFIQPLPELAPEPESIALETMLKTRYYLVQYSRGQKDLVQKIVEEKDISWPSEQEPNPRDVLISDGDQTHMATVLCIHNNLNYLNLEFQKLQQFCFEMGMDVFDESFHIDDDAWILILYTYGPRTVAYSIINHNQTYWREINRYKDVFSYITDGTNVYKALIVRKTKNKKELMDQLTIMRNASLTLDFPLDIDIDRKNAVPPKGFNSDCGSLEVFHKFATAIQVAESCDELKLMEFFMKNDSAWLLQFAETMENAIRVLEQRKYIIVDSLDIPGYNC